MASAAAGPSPAAEKKGAKADANNNEMIAKAAGVVIAAGIGLTLLKAGQEPYQQRLMEVARARCICMVLHSPCRKASLNSSSYIFECKSSAMISNTMLTKSFNACLSFYHFRPQEEGEQ